MLNLNFFRTKGFYTFAVSKKENEKFNYYSICH